jgi:hypothetical protein
MTVNKKTPGTGTQGLPESPPPGTGRLSIQDLCDTYGLDPQELLTVLKTKNIAADASEPLRDIAGRHNMGARDLYAVIRSAAAPQAQ